jgi:hypothetical protein
LTHPNFGRTAVTDTDVNSVLGLLGHVVVDSVADVSEVHATSIFKVKGCRLKSYRVHIAFSLGKEQGEGGYIDEGPITALSPLPHSYSKQNAINTQQLTNLCTLTLKMEAACISKTLATSPTATWSNNTRPELTPIINHCERLK